MSPDKRFHQPSTTFPNFRIYGSRGGIDLVVPSVDNRVAVEIMDELHDALFQLVFGIDADVTEYGAGGFGEEPLDEIEPGAVLGGEHKLKTSFRSRRQPRLGLLRDVRGVIIKDDLDRGQAASSILRNSMNSRLRWRSLTKACTWPVIRSMPAIRVTVPWRLYS
jgi:hypothetical protein